MALTITSWEIYIHDIDKNKKSANVSVSNNILNSNNILSCYISNRPTSLSELTFGLTTSVNSLKKFILLLANAKTFVFDRALFDYDLDV